MGGLAGDDDDVNLEDERASLHDEFVEDCDSSVAAWVQRGKVVGKITDVAAERRGDR